jgi:hypothetical protein
MPVRASMATYKIRVEGHLGPPWSAWFEGLVLTRLPSGETELAGELADEAALHGVLLRVRDLGLSLVSLRRVRTKPRRRQCGRQMRPSC